jgi:UDP-3-O-[3-hydroxymyristoyl] glucosamine N-acyltransferase
MSATTFHCLARPFTLGEIAEATGARLRGAERVEGGARAPIAAVAALDAARPGDLTFYDHARCRAALADCRATACFVRERHAALLPDAVVALVVDDPHLAMSEAMARMFPGALRPESLFAASGVSPGAVVHSEARLEPGVTVDPCAVIGPRAEIGSGTMIGAHAAIGPNVRIGRGCSIGAHASVQHALIGDRVIIHPGARLGQDGFGYAATANGWRKTPQLGRVIVQDDVEIGAGAAIDRGAMRDTIVGEGTKIDNLVQIGHNVVIGRGCAIVAQTGIAGSTTIGDFVCIGGQAAIAGHLTIGEGAQIAAKAGVMRDAPPGARLSGAPARPIRRHLRGEALLDRLARREPKDKGGAD